AESLASDPGGLNAYFEGSQDLLHTIADVQDIRSVFPLVSEIAKRMLPHDALTMASQDQHLTVELEATSHDGFSEVDLGLAGTSIEGELVIGDLAKEMFGMVGSRDIRKRIEAAGYRSLLRVAIQSCDRRVGLAFWSKQAYAYDRRPLPLAHRIVGHLALGVSHERRAKSGSAAE